MEITEFTSTDLPALPPLQPPAWRDIRLAFEFYLSGSHFRPVKITAGDTLVGVGAAIRLERTGWLGHVIVHPDHRSRGIGRRIVADLLARLQDAGCDTVSLVATDEGYPLYESAGFVPVARYRFFERSYRSDEAGLDVRVSRARDADLEAMLHIDREVTGEGREVLISGQAALVYRDGAGISGFYCPNLGEGFIAALDPGAGAGLLAAHMERSAKVSLPEANVAGIRMLLEAGFTEVRRSTRMVLGEPFVWRPECIYGRIGGNLG